jgi:hypothetical protein
VVATTPIIQKTGATSGPSAAGQGSNDLVPGERVDLADIEGDNVGAAYLWEFEDTPVGTTPTMIDPTSATPHFFVDGDAYLGGSYRVLCNVNGLEFSTEVFAKPLTNTGARIPSFQEQEEYDEAGNPVGWHEAQTVYMRVVDDLLGDAQTSVTERQASVTVAQGNSTQEAELGGVVYPGSALAVSGKLVDPVTAGSVEVRLKVNGVVKLTAILNLGAATFAADIEAAGVHELMSADLLTVEVEGIGYGNLGAAPSDLSITFAASNSLSNEPLTIPDSSNISKGITKLSLAPSIATEPVAVGTNDPRNSDARFPTAHDLGGAEHNSSTLAQLNAKVSDATLIDTTDARLSDDRDPNAHDLAGADHNSATLAQLNAKISDATLIDTTDARLADDRDPNAHDLAGADHNSATLAQLNAKVSDATLDDVGDPRDADAIITTSGGGTTLAVGAVADGEFLKRVGAAVVSSAASVSNPLILQTDGFPYGAPAITAPQYQASIAIGHVQGPNSQVKVHSGGSGIVSGWCKSWGGAPDNVSLVEANSKGTFASGYARGPYGGGGGRSKISAGRYGGTALGYTFAGYDPVAHAYIQNNGSGGIAHGHAEVWAGNGTARIRGSAEGMFCGGAAYTGSNLDGEIKGGGRGAISHGFVYDGFIQAYGDGAIAAGRGAYGGTVAADGDGAIAVGYCDDAGSFVRASGRGASAFGRTNGAGSEVRSTNNGSMAHGYAVNDGEVEASGWGSFAGGNANGALSEVKATAAGSIAHGSALNGNDVHANGDGSMAIGYARNFRVSANAVAAFACGLADTEILQVTGQNSQQFGEGSNSQANSLQVGNAGLRLHHKAVLPITPQNGDIWMIGTEAWIRSNAISGKITPANYNSVRRSTASGSTSAPFNPLATNNGGAMVAGPVTPNGIVFTATTGRFTVGTTGAYEIISSLFLIHSTSTPSLVFGIRLNGITMVWSAAVLVHSAVDPTERTIATILNLTAADYIEVWIQGDGASTLQAVEGCSMVMKRLG